MPVLQLSMRPIAMFIFVLAICCGTIFTQSLAQTIDKENPIAGATPGGVNAGASSDAELWRQIRQGKAGRVVGGDKSGGLMIQSGGQDWRLIRNGPLPMYTAWAILGTLLALSLFFAIRGRIKIDSGRSTETIKRFSVIERMGHWLLASSFIVLALTGLNLIFGKTLLIPIMGKEIFASITVFGKLVHNYVGFAFMLGLVMIAVMWIAHNIPNWNDVKWLARGGGLFFGGHPPAKKFNAGQKIIFWVVLLCGISISLSGWALMNPFTTNMFGGTFALVNGIFGSSYPTDLSPIQEQQYQSLWHAIMAVFMIVVVLAHIYIGSIGMEGAIDAVTSGEVDKNWAKEHHSLWVAEEEAKSNRKYSSLKANAPTSKGSESEGLEADIEHASPPKVDQPDGASSSQSTVTTKTEAHEVQSKKSSPAPLTSKARAKKNTPTATGAQKDDLKRIKGIGPQNEQRLNGIGITRFDEIAKWSRGEQAEIGERLAFPGRIEREEWVKQAKALAELDKKA